MSVLTELVQHEGRVRTSELHIDDMKGIIIGKVLSNLQRMGLADGTKRPKEHVHLWEATESGRALVNSELLQAQELPDPDLEFEAVKAVEPKKVKPHIPDYIPPEPDIPPTTPDHFVFIVSEQKLQDMLLSRLGSGAEDFALLKARIKTLEMTIVENKRQMDLLRRERDTALEMAEYLEAKVNKINEALKGMM